MSDAELLRILGVNRQNTPSRGGLSGLGGGQQNAYLGGSGNFLSKPNPTKLDYLSLMRTGNRENVWPGNTNVRGGLGNLQQ